MVMSLMELLTCLYLRSNIFLMELTFGSSETACFIVTEKIDIINAICIDVGKQQFRVFSSISNILFIVVLLVAPRNFKIPHFFYLDNPQLGIIFNMKLPALTPFLMSYSQWITGFLIQDVCTFITVASIIVRLVVQKFCRNFFPMGCFLKALIWFLKRYENRVLSGSTFPEFLGRFKSWSAASWFLIL